MYAKNFGGFGNEKHISAHLLDFKAMSRETGYKTRHLHVGERGKEGVCVFCASACLFEKGRGLWQPLNSHRKATFYSELNRHQIQHKNTHTSTLCTHKRYSPNSIKFHYTLLEDMFVLCLNPNPLQIQIQENPTHDDLLYVILAEPIWTSKERSL